MQGPSIRAARTRRHDPLDGIVGGLFDALVGNLDVAVLVSDVRGVIRLWNDAAERLYGWSAEEAIGSLAADLIVPLDERDRSGDIRRAVLATGSWEGRFTCRRRDGELVRVRVVDVGVTDAEGVTAGIVCITSDLSDEMAAERGAKALDALAAVSSAAVMTVMGETVTSWNPAAQRLLGWSADDMLGESVWKIIPADLVDACQHVVDRVHRGEPVGDHVTERLARDGARVPVRVDVAPVLDPVSHEWFGVVTMTDQRSRDEVIEAAAAAETRFRMLMASSSELVAVIAADHTIKALGPSEPGRLGLAGSAMVGSHVEDFVHPEDRELTRRAIESVASRPEEQATVLYRRIGKDRRWRWAEATLTNLLHDPIVGGIVANVQDVDDREVARTRLIEREALYRALFETAADVAMVVRLDGVIGEVTPSCERVLGRRPDDLVGRKLGDVIGLPFADALRRAHADGRPELLTTAVRRGTSDTIWVDGEVRNLSDDPAIRGYVVNLRDVTSRVSASLVDDLTGVPNRNALVGLLHQALARTPDAPAKPVGVVFFDIDDFCDVNDALGHTVGDALLAAMVDRLVPEMPDDCTLTRFGDDQFAVVCRDLADESDAMEVAGLVQSALEAPFRIGDHEVFVVVSVGVAISPPDDVDVLLRRADTALYRAKRAGRGQTVLFARELATQSRRRLHLAGELRRAIERCEIRPHYQPVVDMTRGEVVAVEALARWHHPERGLVPPDDFIPVAEATGLIGEMGQQVLEQACRDAASWAEQGVPLQVAVNASAVQLMDRQFPGRVAETLRSTGLAAQQLTVEITETAAMREMDTVLQTLGELRGLGVGLSLDDFGTGYSSLSLLKRLPVGALKIDRSFVSGLGRSTEDDRIVTGVVSLALVLGFRVVAEGVETPAQAELLRDLGCQFGQGYLWSAAVPADRVLDTVRELSGRRR